MPYAKEDVFGFVCLFLQNRTAEEEENMKYFTQSVIAEALKLGGTFYLPYRLHYTAEQVLKSYPNIGQWINIKRKYDPDLLLKKSIF